MKVVIDIPKDFTGDYIADKFKGYEKEIAEMFLKAYRQAIDKSVTAYS